MFSPVVLEPSFEVKIDMKQCHGEKHFKENEAHDLIGGEIEDRS
jgi:hypothetical protein